MRTGKALSAVIAVALVSAPAAAQPAIGLDQARVGAATEGESLRGASPVVIAVVIAAVLGLLIVLMSNGSEPEPPQSP